MSKIFKKHSENIDWTFINIKNWKAAYNFTIFPISR